MSNEFYSDHDYTSSSYSSTEEEYDREFILDATTVDEERFITPHGELTSSDEESNVAHNGSSEEDRLDEPINRFDEETHNYSSTNTSSEEDDDEQISSSSDYDDESNDLPWNILEYLDGISFENDCQKAKIVTDQCKYTLEENVKCFKCHVCGDTYSAEGILDNHSYHPKERLPECPTCNTPIKISVLLELFDKATVLEFIKTRFNEQLSTPAFEAYIDTIKLLHENGYIDPDSDKKTIIAFLKELVEIRDGLERPIPMNISQPLYACVQRIESFINELLDAFNPELTDKRMRLMDMLNELPVKYGLAHEPFKPKRELRKISGEFIKSDTIIYHAPESDYVYTHKVDSPIAEIEIREKIIRQSPVTDSELKGYVHSTGEFDPNCIPEIRKYIPKNPDDYQVCTYHYSTHIPYSDFVNIIQTECIVMKKAYVLIPQVISLKDAFHGSTEQRINVIQYYIEYAILLADYIEIEPYRSNLLHNADDLLTEYETWLQTYKRTINSPSEIIGMVYQMITENGWIETDFKASTHSRTYSIFKRSNVPIQVLIDATIDAMVPMATPAQRRIINEMLTKNEKENPFHRCPLQFLKSLSINGESICSCGGPILEQSCLLCGQQYCKHCHEQFNAYHSCNPKVLKTIKVLEETTVRCPKCSTRIQKISGCDHMFCVKCHCNFDWDTGKTIKESEQTNEMYEDAAHAIEREYMYYIRKFISYYENTKRYMLKPKSNLLFFLTCRDIGISLTNINIDKEINRRLQWALESKQYKETYTALRPVIASTIDNAMTILGETIDDYTADRVAENIVNKGIEALRLS